MKPILNRQLRGIARAHLAEIVLVNEVALAEQHELDIAAQQLLEDEFHEVDALGRDQARHHAYQEGMLILGQAEHLLQALFIHRLAGKIARLKVLRREVAEDIRIRRGS
jgi:hypothetical protein